MNTILAMLILNFFSPNSPVPNTLTIFLLVSRVHEIGDVADHKLSDIAG